MDGFPEELKSVVHSHWGTFPPQHPLIPDLFGILFFFLWMLSFLGNGCVVYIFLTTARLRSPVRSLIENLCLFLTCHLNFRQICLLSIWLSLICA